MMCKEKGWKREAFEFSTDVDISTSAWDWSRGMIKLYVGLTLVIFILIGIYLYIRATKSFLPKCSLSLCIKSGHHEASNEDETPEMNMSGVSNEDETADMNMSMCQTNDTSLNQANDDLTHDTESAKEQVTHL